MDITYEIVNTPDYVAVHAIDKEKNYIIGSAEASSFRVYWYINRVIVLNNRAPRNQGIGTKMMKILLQELSQREFNLVVVNPGGYGGDPSKQFRFYRKLGFRAIDESTMLLDLSYEMEASSREGNT